MACLNLNFPVCKVTFPSSESGYIANEILQEKDLIVSGSLALEKWPCPPIQSHLNGFIELFNIIDTQEYEVVFQRSCKAQG